MDHTRSAVQWNCRSVVSKKCEIIYLINKYDPFIFSITETWLKPSSVFKLSGFSCLRDDRPDGWGGAALLIKNSIIYSNLTLPIFNKDNFNAVACLINNICFLSIYIPHPSLQILREVENLLSHLCRPCVVMGDFNSHHRSWGSSISNTLGNDLLDIINNQNLCVLNDGSPTRRTEPLINKSAVDLTITSPSLASSISWKTIASTHGSDHFPIILQFSQIKISYVPRAPPRLKYKINNDKWSDYKSHIENNFNLLPNISQGTTICSDSLTKYMLKAADATFQLKNCAVGRLHSPPWWDAECSLAVAQRKEAELIYSRDMSIDNFERLLDIISKTKKLLKDKKFQGWRRFCLSISPCTKSSEVWKNIRRFRSGVNPSTTTTLPPFLNNSFLDRLAPPTVPPNQLFTKLIPTAIPTCPFGLDAPFSLDELKGVLTDTRDTAPGQDGIPYSFYAHLGKNALQYLLDVINTVMLTGDIPLTWKTQIVLPFLKPLKNSEDSASYRPIALSPVIIKLAEHLIKNRIEWYIESRNILPNSQYGFRKGRSSIDSLSVFTTDIRIAFSLNKSVVAAFLDIKSAYDNVLIELLIQKLKSLNIPAILSNFIQNMLAGRVLILNSTQHTRVAWKGLPQGSVLSPLLYNIYTYDLEATVGDTVSILQYADDLLIYSSSFFIDTASFKLTVALKFLKRWLDKHGLELSASKSTVVTFTRQLNPAPVNINYDGDYIPLKSHAKFLGVILDSKLTGHPHCEYVVDKCEKHLNLLRCLTGVWWGAHPYSLKLIYNALIRSTLDYGTYLLEPGRVAAFKRLDVIQSKAMRIILGAMKTSPINALQVESGDPPLHLRRQYLSSRFLYRALQFSQHQLIPKLQQLSHFFTTCSYWKHKQPPYLVLSYNEYKTLAAPTYQSPLLPIFNCTYQSLISAPSVYFDLNIDSSSSHANVYFNSIVDDRWQGWHQIYTDASKHSPKGFVGVGIYHKQFDIVQKIKFPPETSVFTGECYGIVKALEYVLLMKLKRTVIFSDSMSSLQSLIKFPFRSKKNYPLTIDCRVKLFQCSSRGYLVNFAWIPSHCGITGNEHADNLANEAVESGDVFPFNNFCHDLFALPKIHLNENWAKEWDYTSTVKGRYYRFIQKNIPIKPWYFKIKLSKRATSVLIRMRLGHTCTPAHLARMKIINDAFCSCGDEFGDLNHLFFSCSNYDHRQFYKDLITLHVTLPSNVNILLTSLDPCIYRCLENFIYLNDINI